jgi:CubicO group peptidase (beta-lactamase class C family)
MHLVLAAILLLSHEQTLRIGALVSSFMRSQHIAGLSLGIARRGSLLYLHGYGRRDVDRNLSADGYTIYYIGSLTKQFTAALVMQQVAAGTIALQAPLARYLPAVTGAAGRATVAQLLAQTSGIPSYTDASRAEIDRIAATDPNPWTLWSLVASKPLAFEPGTQWQYSNSNYLLLGMTLARVTGLGYSTLIEQRIARPLTLESTAFGSPGYARNVASGYVWHTGFTSIPLTPGLVNVAFSAGGLASNAPDLLRWLEALRTGRVVSPDAFALMTTSVRLRSGRPALYGFGFFVDDWYGHPVASHTGNIDGFSSEDVLVLDDGLEIAILSNADRVDLVPLGKSIVAMLDRARDSNLYASPSQPAENENAAITAAVKAIAATSAFSALGAVISVEFIERHVEQDVTYDRYRVTFTSGPWRVTVGYLNGNTIRSLTFAPDAG